MTDGIECNEFDLARENDEALCLAGDEEACCRVFWSYYGLPTLLAELERAGIQLPGNIRNPVTGERVGQSVGIGDGGILGTGGSILDELPDIQRLAAALAKMFGAIDPVPFRHRATTFRLAMGTESGNPNFDDMRKSVFSGVCSKLEQVIAALEARAESSDMDVQAE